MNIQQRAAQVERVAGCPRCTAWGHKREDCTMRANSCGVDLTGTQGIYTPAGTRCIGDHSRLLHACGNVYCGVAKIRAVSTKQASTLA